MSNILNCLCCIYQQVYKERYLLTINLFAMAQIKLQVKVLVTTSMSKLFDIHSYQYVIASAASSLT